jgi:hypothetical protein
MIAVQKTAGLGPQGEQIIRVSRPWLKKSPDNVLKISTQSQKLPIKHYLEITQCEESWNAIGEVEVFDSSKTEYVGSTGEDTWSIDADYGSENDRGDDGAN